MTGLMLRLAVLTLAAVLCLAAPVAAHEPDEAVPLPSRSGPTGGELLLHGDPVPEVTDAHLQSATARAALTRLAPVDPDAPRLADRWCGVERAADDTANAAKEAGAFIKVVYAYPADVTNRFAARADLLQADARDISDSFALAADGSKTVRFDVGTTCGAPYLDIAVIALPRTKAAYTGASLNTRVSMLQADLGSRLAGVAGTRNALVYLEDLYAGDGVAGVATLYSDDRHSASNYSNLGGQFAFVLGNLGGTSRRTTAQHELGHNLGAVQDSAPNSTQAGHCFERYDVMCYADGGTSGQSANMVTRCPDAATPAWDCNRDDYFHPNPAPGSYLATHWNLYDSAFLCNPLTCFGDVEVTTTAPPPSGGTTSGGGGGGGGGGSTGTTAQPPTTTTTTPPTAPPVEPPRVVPVAPATAAAAVPTLSEQVRSALDSAQARLDSALGAAGGVSGLRAGRTLRLRVTSPAAGTLVARLTLRGRTVVRATAPASAGRPVSVALKPSARARRSLRGARPAQLALKLTLRSR